MDREALADALQAEFGAADDAARAIARQAGDLHDSGQVAADLGVTLTVDVVLEELADAPTGHSAIERWNWWLGSLELSHGGYERFRVRPDVAEE